VFHGDGSRCTDGTSCTLDHYDAGVAAEMAHAEIERLREKMVRVTAERDDLVARMTKASEILDGIRDEFVPRVERLERDLADARSENAALDRACVGYMDAAKALRKLLCCCNDSDARCIIHGNVEGTQPKSVQEIWDRTDAEIRRMRTERDEALAKLDIAEIELVARSHDVALATCDALTTYAEQLCDAWGMQRSDGLLHNLDALRSHASINAEALKTLRAVAEAAQRFIPNMIHADNCKGRAVGWDAPEDCTCGADDLERAMTALKRG
jgi:hypothetical protein